MITEVIQGNSLFYIKFGRGFLWISFFNHVWLYCWKIISIENRRMNILVISISESLWNLVEVISKQAEKIKSIEAQWWWKKGNKNQNKIKPNNWFHPIADHRVFLHWKECLCIECLSPQLLHNLPERYLAYCWCWE